MSEKHDLVRRLTECVIEQGHLRARLEEYRAHLAASYSLEKELRDLIRGLDLPASERTFATRVEGYVVTVSPGRDGGIRLTLHEWPEEPAP